MFWGSSMFAERFADIAIRVWQRDAEVLREIERLGKICGVEVEVDENVGVVIKGRVNSGVSLGLEPPLALVLLGFGLFGQLWPLTPDFKEAHKIVMRRWREIHREMRGKQRA